MTNGRYECNLCGSSDFADFRNRDLARCAKCGSLERTRALRLLLGANERVMPGMRVLHLAPELEIGRFIRGIVGSGYDARDYAPGSFPKELGVQAIDLVKECESLRSESYDLIIHVHVLEHLACNYTAVLYHLHRSLTQRGNHLFGVPIHAGSYGCNFNPLSAEDRVKQFGQADHMRRFGRVDLRRTLGMIFDLKPPDLKAQFGSELLERYRIPERSWSAHSSDTIFTFRKEDLRLRG